MAGVGSGSESFWGAGGPPHPGRIEYRLMRESVVSQYRRGRLGRLDVCDAQPELLRVARNVGRETTTTCPICADAKLVHVSFAFGPRLPSSGRALVPGEIVELTRNEGEFACYVVEVCTKCCWNHLLRMFTVGSQGRTKARR
ncbi:MAG: DUF5318 family protein [Acidimicrobiales bacterium]